jgi:hypothetical protein
MDYLENGKNTGTNAWRMMMREFREGKAFPVVGTWRVCWERERPFEIIPKECPGDFIPRGATYPNLQHLMKQRPEYLYNIGTRRQARRKRKKHTTRKKSIVITCPNCGQSFEL